MIALAGLALATFLDPIRAVTSVIATFLAAQLRLVFAIPILLAAAIAMSIGLTEFRDQNVGKWAISDGYNPDPDFTTDQLMAALKQDGYWEDDRDYFIGVRSKDDYERVKAAVSQYRSNCRTLAVAFSGGYVQPYQEIQVCKTARMVGGTIGSGLQMVVFWLLFWRLGYVRRSQPTIDSTTSTG